jgi:hypothetical protein
LKGHGAVNGSRDRVSKVGASITKLPQHPQKHHKSPQKPPQNHHQQTCTKARYISSPYRLTYHHIIHSSTYPTLHPSPHLLLSSPLISPTLNPNPNSDPLNRKRPSVHPPFITFHSHPLLFSFLLQYKQRLSRPRPGYPLSRTTRNPFGISLISNSNSIFPFPKKKTLNPISSRHTVQTPTPQIPNPTSLRFTSSPFHPPASQRLSRISTSHHTPPVATFVIDGAYFFFFSKTLIYDW